MSLVRLARDTGSGEALWPRGVKRVEDLPYELVRSIEHANRIISWQENLMADDMPPSYLWPYDSELEIWFDEVAASKASDDTTLGDDDVGNELAERFK